MADWREELSRKAWLLPFVYAMATSGVEARPGSLARAVGVKTRVAKPALLALKRCSAVEEGRLRDEVREWLASQDVKVRGRRMVWRKGGQYVLIVVKRTRVAVYDVPGELVEAVEAVLKSIGAGTARDVAATLKVPSLLASRALQVLHVLGRVERVDSGYRYA